MVKFDIQKGFSRCGEKEGSHVVPEIYPPQPETGSEGGRDRNNLSRTPRKVVGRSVERKEDIRL
jgi:hypothetical protein